MFESKTVEKTTGADRARGVKRVAAGFLLAIVGTVAVSAGAQGMGGPRGGPGEFGGPGLFMGPAEHADRGVDRMLEGLNASDAQRTQIKQIVQAASADLKAQRDAARGSREQGIALFTAPVVDARAVETMRQQNMARHDQASKRITQAMLDISTVLTPEQRVKMGERIKQHAKRMEDRRQRGGPASAPVR